MSTGGAPLGDEDLIYRLRALPLAGAVLHLGAHPDDEDSGTIAFLSRGLGVRTVYWSATRGEGGQNRFGPERGEALGIVRTWESLEARQLDGGEVLYGPFIDYGFSKSGEEALSKWGREELIREVARAIRLVQPQVVIGRWSGGAGDGHGHHQALGLVTRDAFDAAGDLGALPELDAQGLPPWRPQKLYFSLQGDWQPGEDVTLGALVAAHEREGVVRVNAGAYDPVSGRTFQELAALGRNRHRTQAMAELPKRGDYLYYYALERSSVPAGGREDGFFDGLDPTLTGLASNPGGPEALGAALERARERAEAAVRLFHPDEPGRAGEAVVEGLEALRDAAALAADSREARRPALDAILGRKLREFEEAAARCFGLALECQVTPRRVVPGEALRVTVRVWSLGSPPADEATLELRLPEGWQARPDSSEGAQRDEEGESFAAAGFEVTVPAGAAFSSPYWLRQPAKPYRYCWPQGAPAGLPFDPPLVSAAATVSIGGQTLTLVAGGATRETFVGGYRELPLAVLPPLALEPREGQAILPRDERAREVDLQVGIRATHAGGADGEVVLAVPEGWDAVPPSTAVDLPRGGESRSLQFRITVPPGADESAYQVRYGVTSGEHRHGVVLTPVWQGAPGVPRAADETTCIAEAFVVTPAVVSVHVVDADFVRRLRYAYVEGAGDEIPPALERFGLDLTVLSEDDLAFGDLSAYDTLVVGPNAYLARDAVRRSSARLLEYTERGGTLIVQYQGYGYAGGPFAPYPFRYSQPHDRVTFPDAPVRVLGPDHPILHVPNTIAPRDFDGWVHDRGLYFFGEWDSRYLPLLECHDPGEEPKRGGLLVAGYGRGAFVYAGYSFFRQIPAAVPGAIRLFANLLGLAEARIRERMALARIVPLFAPMSDDELYDVARLMSERWFADGDTLARQGEPGSELFLVLEGEVEVLKETSGGPRRYLATRGEAVGELAILADVPRSATLRARGDVKVLAMSGDHFRRLLREHWEMAEAVLRLLAMRLATREEGG